MKTLNHAVRTLYALVETLIVYLALFYLVRTLFNQSWRAWIDDAVWARATPSGLTVLGLLALLRFTRKRYSPSTWKRIQPDLFKLFARGFAAVSLCAAPVSLVMGIDRVGESGTLQLITISAAIASLLNVLCIALTEEFIYRYVLMGRLLRLGVPVLVSLAIQASLFTVAHGKQAFIAPHTVAWYFVGGLTLGTLYATTRSMTCTVALHAIVDICIAQTSPVSYWLTQRAIDAMRHDWTVFASGIWSFALLAYWALAARSKARIADGSPEHAVQGFCHDARSRSRS